MKKGFILLLIVLLIVLPISACAKKTPKIGVSMGVGAATRWAREEMYMKDYAEKNGIEIETRRNLTDAPKTQKEDCIELINSGIDVLIITPRDIEKVDEIAEILAYAKKKKVKVISYARMIVKHPIDLFVGYDNIKIGEQLGTYLTEVVRSDYVVLRGPSSDNNAKEMYEGTMKVINDYVGLEIPLNQRINIAADIEAPDWKKESAAALFLEALTEFGKTPKAIVAPNDQFAEAVIDVLTEKGYTADNMPYISGMDTELNAVKRIIAGTQSMSLFMDLKKLAEKAMELACQFARGEKVSFNEKYNNDSGSLIEAFMITGEIINKNNVDRLIEAGLYTYDQIYT